MAAKEERETLKTSNEISTKLLAGIHTLEALTIREWYRVGRSETSDEVSSVSGPGVYTLESLSMEIVLNFVCSWL
jgi:hypothetical protein